MDTVRVLRIIEYTGPRDAVEEQIKMSLHGERRGCCGPISLKSCTIRAATLGEFPEIMSHIVLPYDATDEEIR